MIDEGVVTEPPNRVTNTLAELGDDLAVVESFSHMVVFRTDDGLVSFDASGKMSGKAVMEALRGWTSDPIHSLIYTHGHVDHVGGSGAVIADAQANGHRRPRVLGHENVPKRMQRYNDTNGWNVSINARQFGGVSPKNGLTLSDDEHFLAPDAAWPDVTYRDHLNASVGGLDLQLHHSKGETDDHTWAWVPKHRALCVGDLAVWVFPNAGNPQKVQRYPVEWAEALRTMMAYDAELLLPAHGLPIIGHERIQRVLGDLAGALESLVSETLTMMNQGATLDEIIHSVRVDEDKLSLPWMRPVYDEPEFVVRNIWRLYGGWWDGAPANLKPSPQAQLAAELADLAGGAAVLAERARAVSEQGDHRLASHLIDYAAAAAPDDRATHAVRADIYRARRAAESSLMSKGIYAAAARESDAVAQLDE
jgi:alkyl sulfatase BDS1-like metallo-beta-lactamase superfamily hydrolase